MMIQVLNNKILSLACLSLMFACAEKEDKKLKFTAQLRSTGNPSLSLTKPSLLTDNPPAFLANSAVNVEAFEIPIGRINLSAGDTGSGYAEASPPFYQCPESSNEGCAVDIVNTTLNDLLKSGSTPQEVKFESEKTYTGTAVEICAEGLGGPGTSYKARLKASATLADQTYYTKSTGGLASTGPAEFVEITMPCGGLNTDLVEPIRVSPDSTVNLIFWVDPSASVILTNNGPLVNSNCTSSTVGELTFCAGSPTVFGTTVAGAATAERYLLDVETLPGNGASQYGDILVTVVSHAEGLPIGASMKQLFTNTAGETKTLHAPLLSFDKVELTNNQYSFGSITSGTETLTVISGLNKNGTTSDLTLSTLVDTALTLNASKL